MDGSKCRRAVIFQDGAGALAVGKIGVGRVAQIHGKRFAQLGLSVREKRGNDFLVHAGQVERRRFVNR